MINWIHDALVAHPFWGVVICLLLLAASIGETPEQRNERIEKGMRQDPIDNVFSWIAAFVLIFLILVWIHP